MTGVVSADAHAVRLVEKMLSVLHRQSPDTIPVKILDGIVMLQRIISFQVRTASILGGSYAFCRVDRS